jgi:hypothetical protein
MKNELYQHPYVDIFAAFKVNESKKSLKEGDVSETFDKQLAKNVLKITGATPSSNYYQVPYDKQK